jgi:hypothetical protein
MNRERGPMAGPGSCGVVGLLGNIMLTRMPFAFVGVWGRMDKKESQVQRTKRQHYVPQFYLRQFCPDGKGLFVFDKTTRRRFQASFSDIALEKEFYDMPGEVVAKACPGQNVDLQFVEKSFSKMEGWARPMFDELLETVDRKGVIPRKLRLNLAPYIIVQHMRTALSRRLFAEMTKKQREAEANAYLAMKEPEAAEAVYVAVDVAPHVLPVLQARAVFDENLVVGLASIINHHIWFVGMNKTIQPFYTSDHPVAKKASLKQPGRSFSGFRSRGVQIAFPLSSRHVLVMLERSHFRHMAKFDGLARFMDPFGVEYFNTLQVLMCHKQVYCQKNEFEQAEGVCRLHPEACVADRPRVEAVQNGDVFGILVDR